jgi:hypothetical protein
MENNNLHTDKENCIKTGCTMICITARNKTTYYKTIKVKNIEVKFIKI